MARKIELDEFGFAVVDMNIRPEYSPTMIGVSYKVDSGASCTTISRSELKRLGYDEQWIKKGKKLEAHECPTLASGEPVKNCYLVILPEIQIGEWVAYNWPFMTSLSASFKPLLGTDSMSYFTWFFDYKNNICEFELIETKRKLLFNSLEQSIHAIDDIEEN